LQENVGTEEETQQKMGKEKHQQQQAGKVEGEKEEEEEKGQRDGEQQQKEVNVETENVHTRYHQFASNLPPLTTHQTVYCTALINLNIRSTAFTRLPRTSLNLKDSLAQFECNPTDPLIFSPAAVLGVDETCGDDTAEILTHTRAAFSFMEATDQGAMQLTRYRLMLIGDGGSGKPTLKSALLWSRTCTTAEQVRVETKRKLGAWAPTHVRQWIMEVSDGHAELADKFVAGKISGQVLLALHPSDVVDLYKGTYRNDVEDKITRMIVLLSTPPAALAV
jgi:hypothetical protein